MSRRALLYVLLVAACKSESSTVVAPPADGDDGGSSVTPDDAGAGDDASTQEEAAPPPQKHTIAFDDVPQGTTIATQYPGVTFSTAKGETIRTEAFGSLCQTSEPNTLQAGAAGVFDSPITLDFARPVSGLTFRIGCVQRTGSVIAKARLTRSGAPVVEVPIQGTGYSMSVDLSTYSNVTRLEIVEISDDSGLAFDDFSFLE
jgi:hypothetical protein